MSAMVRPKTAFVLAGGGSLGAVEVGMLEALVERGVVPDLVVGSSVGAINGAYFAGHPTAQGVAALATMWRGLRRSDVFPISPFGSLLSLFSRRNHLVEPARLRHLIESNLRYREIRQASLPLHVVATDLLTGQEVLLSSGPVVEAVMARAAIPAVFPPVKIGGRCLVDGGVANNTPVSVAVGLGAEKIIVLPTGFACAIASPPSGALAMALHGLSLLIARQLVVDIERLAGRVSVCVVPPLCPMSTTAADFSRAGELIEEGAARTRLWLDSGGLDTTGVPESMIPHSHAPQDP